MPNFSECPDPNCKSRDTSIVKREPVNIGRHFTDLKITYQCNSCGKPWTIGG